MSLRHRSERKPLTTKQNFEVNSVNSKILYFIALTPNYPNSVFLEWINDNTDIISGVDPDFEYSVYRSESPEGAFTLLNSTPTTDLFYNDVSIEQFSLTRNFFYKVIAAATNTTFVIESAVTALQADITGIKRRRFLEHQKIKRDRRIQLSMVNSELFYLKRRSIGSRCPDCYIEQTRDQILDKCLVCYGTTFENPYHTPIRLLVEYSQEQKRKSISEKDYVEINAFTINMQDTPRANRDDLLVDLNNTRIYKIISIAQTMLSKAPLSQTLTVSELSRDSIEYKIPVNRSSAIDLYPYIERKVI